MELEIWKPIDGYEKLYEISNFGNVKSLAKTYITGKGRIINQPDIIMKPASLKKKPYQRVMLRKNKKFSSKLIHRLVALAFIPNPSNKEQVNHIDGNVKNNKVNNLEWVSKSENIIHGFNVLKTYNNKGGNNPQAKKIICTITGKIFGSTLELSKFTGLSRYYLQQRLSGKIKNNLNYKYL